MNFEFQKNKKQEWKNTSAFFIFDLDFVAEKFQIAIFKLKNSEQVIMDCFFGRWYVMDFLNSILAPLLVGLVLLVLDRWLDRRK